MMRGIARRRKRSKGRSRQREGYDQFYNKLKDGSLKLYELEKELSPIDAIRVRREFIAQETGADSKTSASSPSISSAWSSETART